MSELKDNQKLINLCKQKDISYLGLFGSYARGEQKDSSDIDLLVNFKQPVGYFKLVQVQNDIKDLLNKGTGMLADIQKEMDDLNTQYEAKSTKQTTYDAAFFERGDGFFYTELIGLDNKHKNSKP